MEVGEFGQHFTLADLLMSAEGIVPGRESKEESRTGRHEALDEPHKLFLIVDVFDDIAHDDDIEGAVGCRAVVDIVKNEGKIRTFRMVGEELLGQLERVGIDFYSGDLASEVQKRLHVAAHTAPDFQHAGGGGDFNDLTDIWNHEFISRDGLFVEVTSVIGVPFLHWANVGKSTRERRTRTSVQGW